MNLARKRDIRSIKNLHNNENDIIFPFFGITHHYRPWII